jgi:hypothetical protein
MKYYGLIKDALLLGSTFVMARSEPSLAQARCPNAPLAQEKCAQVREQAVSSGCITADQRIEMENWKNPIDGSPGRFPMCVGAIFVGDCPCGCFSPDTKLLTYFPNGDVGWTSASTIAKNIGDFKLWSLQSHSTLSNLISRASNISSFTEGNEEKPLVIIETENGGRLTLTLNHAVLISTGEVLTARELTKSTKLIDISGNHVNISAIYRIKKREKVYNFMTTGESKIEHLVAAGGVIVGDLSWQNQFEDEINAIAIRK